MDQTFGLFVAITLISIIPSHATMATFSTGDTVLAFAILTGMAAGLARRVTDAPGVGAAPAPTPS
jgi:hypothetical protein